MVYVGGVCSGESTRSKADLRAVVRTFDPVAGAFGPVVPDQELDFPRPVSFESSPLCKGASWYPWTDRIPGTQDGKTCPAGYCANPEPILADITVDTDGSLILGFRDRLTEVMGDEAPLQIGHRVWCDTDKNGIQGPGEPPVVFDDSSVVGGLKTASGRFGTPSG